MSKPSGKRRALQLEPLEGRALCAVSVTLSGSTLTVNGSAQADLIRLRQVNTRILIDGVAQTFATSQVQRIVVNGLEGNDTIRLDSAATPGQQAIMATATVLGGAGNDTIYGTEAGDWLFGEAGDDVICGVGGDDFIDGGQGNDSLTGDAGSDWLFGDLDADRLYGGDGSDSLVGGDGNDSLWGGTGNDQLDGSRGMDALFGEAGNDQLADDAIGNTFNDAIGVNVVTAGHSGWFDMQLADASLRAYVRTLYVDQSFSRADLLATFARVGADGSVSATELADLRVLARGDAPLAESLRELTGKLAGSDAANATYQGSRLGNLVAGSTAAQLQKLVNKWFLGLDRPGTIEGGRTYAYAAAAGSLFVGGVAYADINQGIVGDCYFLASLAEVALRSPQTIQSMFTDNGDGTLIVRFFNRGVATYVSVDRYLPVDSVGRLVYAGFGRMANNANNELWVALAEKAYVQLNECGWVRTANMGGGRNQYNAISGGWVYVALAQVTGRATTWSTMNSQTNLVNAVTAGKMISVSSKSTPQLPGVVGGHAYAVIGYDVATQKFTIFNPWGMNNGAAPDLLRLTWSELVTGFQAWDSSV